MQPEFDAEGIAAYSAVIAVAAKDPDFPLTLLSRHAEALGDRLRAIPATRAVDYFGQPEEEVLVSVDMDKAAALGLGAAERGQTASGSDARRGRHDATTTEVWRRRDAVAAGLDRARCDGPTEAGLQVLDFAGFLRGV